MLLHLSNFSSDKLTQILYMILVSVLTFALKMSSQFQYYTFIIVVVVMYKKYIKPTRHFLVVNSLGTILLWFTLLVSIA